MFLTWTKQFFIATGLFAFVVTCQTMNLVLKEKNLAQKQLKESPRTAGLIKHSP